MEEQYNQEASPKKTGMLTGLDKGSFGVLFTAIILLPLFFLPAFNISLDIAKSAFLFILVAVAFFLWLIARMKSGRFVFPKSIVLALLMIIPAVFLVSALFSEVRTISLMGTEYETGTFFSIFVFSLMAFLSAIFFQERKHIFYLYAGMSIASLLVFLLVVLGLLVTWGILPDFLAPYIFPNVIGKWSDLATFFGLTAILSLVTLELFFVNKIFKSVAIVSLILSLIILALVNFSLLWVVMGVFSLLIFVYAISFGQKNDQGERSERKIPLFSFSVLIVSVVFVLASSPVNNVIHNVLRLNIPQEVVRPSWSATVNIAKETLIKDPVFGTGPNRFGSAWNLHSPRGVNATNVWGVDFTNGIGAIPSLIVTSGSLGFIAWAGFLAIFLYIGFIVIFRTGIEKASYYLITSSFLGAAYLWTIAVFYTPNVVIFAFAFVMTGVFIASLVESGAIKNYDFSFIEDPRLGFVSVLVLILLIISSVVGGYLVAEKFVSLFSFQQGRTLLQQGNTLAAKVAFEQANKLKESDLYYRTLSEIDINSLGMILNQQGISQETIKTQFQVTSRGSIDNALKATQFDPTNYLNWISLARAYETLIPFGASSDFYESAKKNYQEALVLYPRNPLIMLFQARLELLNKNIPEAKQYIAEALQAKNDYVEAIVLLSQIQADEGDLASAIVSIETASLIAPNDISVFFQLGFLRYKNNDYGRAIPALERAIELSPSYSNAKYFLGLSYGKMGRVSDSIRQFEEIRVLNPSNTEVQAILNNLRANGSAFVAPESSPVEP